MGKIQEVDYEVQKLQKESIVNKTKENLRILRRFIRIHFENEQITYISVIHPVKENKNVTRHITSLLSMRFSEVNKRKIKLFWVEKEIPDRFLFINLNDKENFCKSLENIVSTVNISKKNSNRDNSSFFYIY